MMDLCASGLKGQASDEPRRKACTAYTELKILVMRNALRPRERLQANHIAEALHVSVTPTREALQRLAFEHLIGSTANLGYYTKSFDWKEQLGLLWTMEAITSFVMTSDLPKTGVELLKRSDIDGKVSRGQQITSGIRTIVAGIGNRVAAQYLDNALDRSLVILSLFCRKDVNFIGLFDAISSCREAIGSGDGRLAEGIMHSAFDDVRTQVIDLVKEANAEAASAAPLSEILLGIR